jgi:hypothetical protein
MYMVSVLLIPFYGVLSFQCLQIGHNCLLPNLYLIIIQSASYFFDSITYAVETAPSNNIRLMVVQKLQLRNKWHTLQLNIGVVGRRREKFLKIFILTITVIKINLKVRNYKLRSGWIC